MPLGYLKRIDALDSVNSVGKMSTTVWFAGCPFKCEGCHNPDTWEIHDGTPLYEEDLKHILQAKPSATNLSILGGEPLSKENIEATKWLVENFKKNNPLGKVLIWTGYELPAAKGLLSKDVVKLVDYIKVGVFVREKRDLKCKYYGSTNQEFFELHEGLIKAIWSDEKGVFINYEDYGYDE